MCRARAVAIACQDPLMPFLLVVDLFSCLLAEDARKLYCKSSCSGIYLEGSLIVGKMLFGTWWANVDVVL